MLRWRSKYLASSSRLPFPWFLLWRQTVSGATSCFLWWDRQMMMTSLRKSISRRKYSRIPFLAYVSKLWLLINWLEFIVSLDWNTRVYFNTRNSRKYRSFKWDKRDPLYKKSCVRNEWILSMTWKFVFLLKQLEPWLQKALVVFQDSLKSKTIMKNI